MNSRDSTLVFRHWPVIYLVFAMLFFFIYASWLLVASVDRMADPVSVFFAFSLLGIPGLVVVGAIALDMARAHRTLRMTPTHLSASTWFGGSVDVPWTGIRRVRRLPKRWWALGGGAATFEVIETESYEELRYMPYLMRDYSRFIEELKHRVPGFHGFDAHGSRLFPE
jgi:hypothetical protein